MKRNNAKRNGHNRTKASVLLTSLIVLLCFGVVYTAAYLIAYSSTITNTFQPTDVTTAVTESFDGATKSNVAIQNTGKTDAYIRAAIVVTWKDADGNVYAAQPKEGTDYTISINSTDWFKGSDGFYYCRTSVAPNASTPVLINSCGPVSGQTPVGYGLNVEILGSGIQSVPANAVADAWRITAEQITQGGAAE